LAVAYIPAFRVGWMMLTAVQKRYAQLLALQSYFCWSDGDVFIWTGISWKNCKT